MNAKAYDWLRHRPDNDQVGKLQCRVQAGGKWSDWADQEPVLTVADMLSCLLTGGIAVTYMMCKEQFESLETQLKQTELENSLPVPGGASIECRYAWDFRYDPEKLSPKLTDPDAITKDDIINALIALPAPPPGWAFPELMPLLCPLGVGPGWGCPDTPTDPGGSEPGEKE